MKGKRLPKMKTIKVLEFPPPLTKSQITVLETLAKEGPTNAYQIKKKTGKTYSLVFNSFKRLENRGMVRLKAEQKNEKGTIAKIYDLTLKGLLYVLKRNLEKWSRAHLRMIIAKYAPLLPLIFGKWSYFDKMGVGKMALLRLKVVIDSQRRLDDPRSSINIQQIYQGFFFFGFFPYQWGLEGSRIMAQPKAWVSAWKQDKDIKDWVIKDLEDYQQKLGRARVYVGKAISLVKG